MLGTRGIHDESTESINNEDERDIIETFKEVLETDDLSQVKVNDLLAVLQTEALLERFAAKKASKIGKKVPTDLELKSKQNIRRSIVANHNLSAGHKIILEDLDWVRPGGGVRPGNEEKLIGKKLNRAMKVGEIIELKNLV